MGLSAHKMKKHGKTLPSNAQKKTLSAGKPIAKPKGIDPRSSVTGSMEEKNTISSGDMFKSFILQIVFTSVYLLAQSFIKAKHLIRIQKLCNNLAIKQHECLFGVIVYFKTKIGRLGALGNTKLDLNIVILLTLHLYILNLKAYLSDQKSYTHFVHKF